MDLSLRVRTLVIAETRLYRLGLAHMLARDPRIVVVGTAAGLPGGVAKVAGLRPDAVLLDVGLASDARVVHRLLDASSRTRVLAFGVADSEDTLIACAEAGVAGYVGQEADVEQLVAVLMGAIRDELVCGPRVAGTLLRRVGVLAQERRDGRPEVRLTARETQIVALLDDGLSNKEIAARLQISLPTVKNHLHNLFEKLDVRRRGEAVARARAVHARMVDQSL